MSSDHTMYTIYFVLVLFGNFRQESTSGAIFFHLGWKQKVHEHLQTCWSRTYFFFHASCQIALQEHPAISEGAVGPSLCISHGHSFMNIKLCLSGQWQILHCHVPIFQSPWKYNVLLKISHCISTLGGLTSHGLYPVFLGSWSPQKI